MRNNEFFLLEKLDNSFVLTLLNEWNKNTLPQIMKEFEGMKFLENEKLVVNFGRLTQCDSCSIIYLISFFKNLKNQNISFENFQNYEQIYKFYEKHYEEKALEDKSIDSVVENVGKATYELLLSFKNFISFIGKVFYFLIYSLFNPSKIRFKAILKYIDTSAVNALLIVAITSFLVGVVIAYQGAVQLEKFGANIFIVEMISITMLREIAPLLTAIVIAGRSASAYTAEIGAMKITEEIDAMKTMNFEPTMFLTIPRIIALSLSLPLLVFFADFIGIFGGMVIAYINLDISFIEFFHRIGNEVPLKHFLMGIFKSIFFGIAIALIGCYRGFQVQNNTTSIGKYTTISVVNAIFVVIIIDAIFSVIFTEMGI